MNTRQFLKLVSTLLLATLPPAASSAEPNHPVLSVGVLPFSETPESKDLGAALSELVAAQLATSGNLVLVERAQLDHVLAEQGMGASGAVDPQSAARIGQLVGARVLVTGRVFKAGKTTYCIAKAISTSSGRSLPAQSQIADDDLMAAATALAKTLDAAIIKSRAAMLPEVETPDQRISRLKKHIKGKKLPTIHVNIPEQHLSRVVPDPAVKTEIEFTCQKLGIPVATTDTDADIVISGEAFSERAIQIGSLVSCRARCEISVTRKAAPGTKKVNRVTTGATDIAENTAAKLALQDAGKQLADWIVLEILP